MSQAGWYSLVLVNRDLEGIYGMREGWVGYSPGGAVWLSEYYLCKNIYQLHHTPQKSPSVLATDVLGTGIFLTGIAYHKTGTSFPFPSYLRISSARKLQLAGAGLYERLGQNICDPPPHPFNILTLSGAGSPDIWLRHEKILALSILNGFYVQRACHRKSERVSQDV